MSAGVFLALLTKLLREESHTLDFYCSKTSIPFMFISQNCFLPHGEGVVRSECSESCGWTTGGVLS